MQSFLYQKVYVKIIEYLINVYRKTFYESTQLCDGVSYVNYSWSPIIFKSCDFNKFIAGTHKPPDEENLSTHAWAFIPDKQFSPKQFPTENRRNERRKGARSRRDKSRIRKQSCEEGLECFKLASREVASALSRLEYRTAGRKKKASLFKCTVRTRLEEEEDEEEEEEEEEEKEGRPKSADSYRPYRLCQLIAPYRGKPPHSPNHSREILLSSRGTPFLTSVSVIIDTTDTSRPLECYSRWQPVR